MGIRADAGDRGGHPRGTEEVDLNGLRQRRVERNRCGSVDDHIGGAQGGASVVVHSQPVVPDVTGHGVHASVHLSRESISQLGP